MNSRAFLSLAALSLAAPAIAATSQPQAPVPVVQAPGQPAPVAPRAENQRLYAPGQATLVSREAAEAVLQKFRAAYANSESPRIVVYVNRELVDASAGLKLSGHTERYDETETRTENGAVAPAPQPGPGESSAASTPPPAAGTPATTRTTRHTSGENTYTPNDEPAPTLADRQTVRDIERLFGRVFRNAGARLADPQIAASLLPDQPGQRLIGEQATRQRAALAKVADIAVEVLISSRDITVSGISGGATLPVPDIQATAIRLSDAAILGQASATDVLGREGDAARIARQFDVRDITEAVALALVEDMTTGR